MTPLRTGVLVAATVATGLAAGLFQAFAYAVMPGLRDTTDRTFVEAMQQVNVAIVNPWFLVVFLGAPTLTALAAVTHLGPGRRPALAWILAAFVLCLATLVITRGVNIPLNDALDAAGDPADAGLAAVRERFEDRWTRWNLARAATSTAAFGCLAVALALHGRTTSAHRSAAGR